MAHIDRDQGDQADDAYEGDPERNDVPVTPASRRWGPGRLAPRREEYDREEDLERREGDRRSHGRRQYGISYVARERL